MCELPLISAPQGQHNWWIEGASLAQMGSGGQQSTEDLGWTLSNCEDCGSDQFPILEKL